MHVIKTSSWDVYARNCRSDMCLNLALLTPEAGPRPEADVLCKSGPHKSGGQQPPRSTNTRMRELVEGDEQLVAERNRNKRQQGSGGHITVDGGGVERDGDHGE